MQKAFFFLLLSAELLTPPAMFLPVSCSPDNPAPRDPAVFTVHKEVEEVRLSFTVRDAHGKLVSGLTQDDFAVLTDGKPGAEITSFYQHEDLPLRVALVLDTSESMRRQIAAEEQAARAFLAQTVRPEMDKVSVVAFAAKSCAAEGGEPRLTPTASRDRKGAGQTALYDTIYELAREQIGTAEPVPVRRMIIVLSDGEDNWSRHNLDETIVLAQQAEVVIYAVTAHSHRFEFPGDHVLRRLTEATGGQTFVLSRYDSMSKVFAAIAGELRGDYVVGFRPPSGLCGFHSVKIAPRDRTLKVRAKTGYFDGE